MLTILTRTLVRNLSPNCHPVFSSSEFPSGTISGVLVNSCLSTKATDVLQMVFLSAYTNLKLTTPIPFSKTLRKLLKHDVFIEQDPYRLSRGQTSLFLSLLHRVFRFSISAIFHLLLPFSFRLFRAKSERCTRNCTKNCTIIAFPVSRSFRVRFTFLQTRRKLMPKIRLRRFRRFPQTSSFPRTFFPRGDPFPKAIEPLSPSSQEFVCLVPSGTADDQGHVSPS